MFKIPPTSRGDLRMTTTAVDVGPADVRLVLIEKLPRLSSVDTSDDKEWTAGEGERILIKNNNFLLAKHTSKCAI